MTFAFGGQRYADSWRKVEEARWERCPFQSKLLKGLALPRGHEEHLQKPLKNQHKLACLLRHCYHRRLPPIKPSARQIACKLVRNCGTRCGLLVSAID